MATTDYERAKARNEYALETHRQALAMFDHIWPWTWLKWRRERNEVKRRIRVLKDAMANDTVPE